MRLSPHTAAACQEFSLVSFLLTSNGLHRLRIQQGRTLRHLTSCEWVGTGRTAKLCFPIPPVVTVHATFTAHGRRLGGFTVLSALLTSNGIHRLSIQEDYYAPTSQAVALRHVDGFPALRLLWPR
jgi:hypothetical protein